MKEKPEFPEFPRLDLPILYQIVRSVSEQDRSRIVLSEHQMKNFLQRRGLIPKEVSLEDCQLYCQQETREIIISWGTSKSHTDTSPWKMA